ncbi:MAG: MurR/RpiR family transcriptional regulator [Bulleidia sp.]|nr:MurR/RpiR family transcriptional regulator [Bulleidia sp.]
MEFYIKNYDILTNTERDLLHYILDNEELVQKLTAAKLADRCGVSKTVVINMCQKLGFDGYNELKYYLKNKNNNNQNLVKEDNTKSLLVDIVEKTLAINDEVAIDAIAKKICSAECVYVVSRGTSKAIGMYLTHLLLTLNIKCINIPDYNLLDIIAKKMSHNEVMIALSLSGETPIIVQIAKIVKAYGNSLITITAFSNSTLCMYSDYSLYFSSASLDTKNNDVVTRIGMMAVIDYLISYLKNICSVRD